jgi:hypothetical protein
VADDAEVGNERLLARVLGCHEERMANNGGRVQEHGDKGQQTYRSTKQHPATMELTLHKVRSVAVDTPSANEKIWKVR